MKAADFFKANEYKSESPFLEQAQYMRDNWSWLKYSYAVSIRVMHRMKDLGWTQKQLAEAIGCTQQHVSVLVSGRCNMTLETLSKLESALDIDLLSSLMLGIQDGGSEHIGYLSDSGGTNSGITIPSTKHLVAGYGPRKKKGPKKKQ